MAPGLGTADSMITLNPLVYSFTGGLSKRTMAKIKVSVQVGRIIHITQGVSSCEVVPLILFFITFRNVIVVLLG